MDLAETAGYVKHHVGLAGRSDPLFSDDAVALIHQTSRGIPRAVNNLAVHSLVAAFTDGKGLVDESSARAAVVEVTGTEPGSAMYGTMVTDRGVHMIKESCARHRGPRKGVPCSWPRGGPILLASDSLENRVLRYPGKPLHHRRSQERGRTSC